MVSHSESQGTATRQSETTPNCVHVFLIDCKWSHGFTSYALAEQHVRAVYDEITDARPVPSCAPVCTSSDQDFYPPEVNTRDSCCITTGRGTQCILENCIPFHYTVKKSCIQLNHNTPLFALRPHLTFKPCCRKAALFCVFFLFLSLL